MDRYDNDGNVVATDGNKVTNDAAAGVDPAKAEELNAWVNETKEEAAKGAALNVKYILDQMEKIRADSNYLLNALGQVDKITSHPPTMNAADLGAKAKADAICHIVQAREGTNQKMLAMYEKMYEDLKPVENIKGVSEKQMMMEWITDMSQKNNLFGQSIGEHMGRIIDKLFN